jgi:hypothetical protein
VPVDGWHRQPPEHVTDVVVHPALQVQLVEAALPAGELEFDGQALHVELAEAPAAIEYVPAPQSVHRAAPVNAVYLPASHAVHMSPGDEVDPLLQEATKPEECTISSEVNTTCMYPVLDV